jgi:Putative zinc ribbon domain
MTTLHCRSCGSCGFPMRAPNDYAGGNPEAEFCSTCATDKGELKPYAQVLSANAEYFAVEQGIAPEAAQKMARDLLSKMPAWKNAS